MNWVYISWIESSLKQNRDRTQRQYCLDETSWSVLYRSWRKSNVFVLVSQTSRGVVCTSSNLHWLASHYFVQCDWISQCRLKSNIQRLGKWSEHWFRHTLVVCGHYQYNRILLWMGQTNRSTQNFRSSLGSPLEIHRNRNGSPKRSAHESQRSSEIESWSVGTSIRNKSDIASQDYWAIQGQIWQSQRHYVSRGAQWSGTHYSVQWIHGRPSRLVSIIDSFNFGWCTPWRTPTPRFCVWSNEI